MDVRASLTIVAGALVALAIWPSVKLGPTPAAAYAPAPVTRDYELRDRYITFYEREMRRAPYDQIKMRMLAQQYLQRFREQYDLNDIARAQRLAARSVVLQPQGNTAAQMTLASALLSYHDFRGALIHEEAALAGEPSNVNVKAQIASLEMELGRYSVAKRMLDGITDGGRQDPTADAVRARYQELTGDLPGARNTIARAIRVIDGGIDNPAYDRSWYHMRAGQLAFEGGDFDVALQELQESLRIFPDNATALMWEARLYRARKDWRNAFAAARKSAELYPLPQTLGYQADAQRALGDMQGAGRTDALIGAEQRLFDAQGVNDRLLANYYAQRQTHPNEALKAAQSDYRKRGDEIYADDTMGWVLARMSRWNHARAFAERAARMGTQDAEIQYHAAIVALHTGHTAEAKRRLMDALHENPRFDPLEADDARTRLEHLESH